jgi:hypothetical protein
MKCAYVGSTSAKQKYFFEGSGGNATARCAKALVYGAQRQHYSAKLKHESSAM